eukprot:ANDGO_00368.mRNA.1 hypothetical protein DDB_G0295741
MEDLLVLYADEDTFLKQHPFKNSFYFNSIVPFVEKTQSLLEKHIDWNGTSASSIYFAAVSDTHLQPLQSFLSQKGYLVTLNPCVKVELFHDESSANDVLTQEHRDLRLEVSEMDASHVERANSVWPYKHERSAQYIQHCISKRPSVVVSVADTGSSERKRPCAWVWVHSDGSIGGLHVEPQFRNRGLGRLVLRVLISRMKTEFGADYQPFAYVTVHNEPSFRLFQAMGFKQMENATWCECHASPEELRHSKIQSSAGHHLS